MALPTTKGGHVLGAVLSGPTPSMGKFSVYLAAPLPPAPPKVLVPSGVQWNMDGNNLWGDCTIGAAGNLIALCDVVIAGVLKDTTAIPGLDIIPTSDQAVSQYQILSGAKTPGDANDTGLVIASVLQNWTNPGLFGDNKIGGAAKVSSSNLVGIKQVIAAYGCAYVGVALPQSAENQVDSAPAGQIPVWSYVGDDPIGGHAILFVGYDEQYIYAYTWGQVVAVEPAWLIHYVGEVWAVIPQSFVQAGKGPEVDLETLQADLSSLNPPKPPKKRPWWKFW